MRLPRPGSYGCLAAVSTESDGGERRAMRLLLRVFIILAVTAGIYYAADYAFGYLVMPRIAAESRDPALVPGYRNQPYITTEFLTEAAREPGEWRQIYGTKLLTPPEFHGRYFNVDVLAPTGNLYRRTINPPPAKARTLSVLLLGGSIVYGPEVPDALTLASLLSAELNARDPQNGYQVYNAGVYAADSLQERDRLAYEIARGLKPDIVISYGGGMDIVDGVYQAEPGAPAAFLNSRSGLRGLLHRMLPLNIYHWLRDRASAAAAEQHAKAPPAHLTQPAEVSQLSAATTTAWYDNQLAMDRTARAVGARFISVLQPTPYSSSFDHPTADIGYVRGLAEGLTPGLGAIDTRVQKELAAQSAALRQKGVEAVDLSAGFQAKTEDVYVDIGHLNASGHRILAREIAEAVLHPATP
jgi:lysophospholipase L1-like esterase